MLGRLNSTARKEQELISQAWLFLLRIGWLEQMRSCNLQAHQQGSHRPDAQGEWTLMCSFPTWGLCCNQNHLLPVPAVNSFQPSLGSLPQDQKRTDVTSALSTFSLVKIPMILYGNHLSLNHCSYVYYKHTKENKYFLQKKKKIVLYPYNGIQFSKKGYKPLPTTQTNFTDIMLNDRHKRVCIV